MFTYTYTNTQLYMCVYRYTYTYVLLLKSQSQLQYILRFYKQGYLQGIVRINKNISKYHTFMKIPKGKKLSIGRIYPGRNYMSPSPI